MTISLRPSSRVSAMCVWPQQITRASVRVTRSTVTVGSRSVDSPDVDRARRCVADQHQRVARPDAALVGQPAQPVELVVRKLLVRPFGRGAIGRRRLLHPREGGREVVVGDRDVRVAAHDERALGLHRAQSLDDLRRPRSVEHVVTRDRDAIGLVALDIRQLPRRGQRCCRGRRPAQRVEAPSAQHAFARDDERDRRLAAHLAVDAGYRPAAAEAPAELVHGHLER